MARTHQVVSGAQRSEQEGEVREPELASRATQNFGLGQLTIPASTSPTNEQDYL